MVPTRKLLSVFLLVVLGALPAMAGPTSHAMEVADDRAILFVDLDRGRLLRLHEGVLSVVSGLEGVPEGDVRQNLIQSTTGELYLGQKKSVWMLDADGSMELVKPPKEIKSLFINRPGDLAPDGSVYVARDFRNIERSLPGGDAHPVLATDLISKIHSMSVTPYGRVFFSNNSEIAKLSAAGEVQIIQEIEDERVLGLAADGEHAVVVLRQAEGGEPRLERLDLSGKSEIILSAAQIAKVSTDSPLEVGAATD